MEHSASIFGEFEEECLIYLGTGARLIPFNKGFSLFLYTVGRQDGDDDDNNNNLSSGLTILDVTLRLLTWAVADRTH